jgi:hypothetical protein
MKWGRRHFLGAAVRISYSLPTFINMGWPKVNYKDSSKDKSRTCRPTINKQLADLGSVRISMSPAEFDKFIANETDKWGKVIRFANIKPDRERAVFI